jgi:hypothetical protein
MPSNPIRDLWDRLRGVGRRVEEELYDFSEEEERDVEPRGRNALVALLNTFMTLWKTEEANVLERLFGLLGLGSLVWLLMGDRGLGAGKAPFRIAASTFAVLWFVPGLIAALWTLFRNLGGGRLSHWRTIPLVLVFAAGGLISFRAVFGDLARPHRYPHVKPPAETKTDRRGP